MKRTIFLCVIGVCLSASVAFAVDFFVFRYRLFHHNHPFGSVTVQVYYAIQEKNGRTEYVYKSAEQQACASSLFAHSGFPPCWYARRHIEKAVPI